MSKLILIAAVLLIAVNCNFLRSHNYWYTATKSLITTGVPFSDYPWNYCDDKCLYLENYIPAGSVYDDMVVISFTEAAYKGDFAACYVRKSTDGVANGDYKLWS